MAAVMAASIGLHLLWQLVDLPHEYAFSYSSYERKQKSIENMEK